MAQILWVNPVGSGAFDEETLALIDAVRSPAHTPRVRHLDEGPPHLEYHLYEHAAFGPMLQLMRDAEVDGCGAGIIGCFSDGGLGHRFSIVVGRRKWIPKMSDNVVLYGLERRLASFRSVEMGIPDVLAEPERFFDRVIEEGRRAVEDDGAEVIVLSEIASPAFWQRAAKELPVPLVDPGVACWKWAELAADLYQHLGLTHSKVYGFESPPLEPTRA
jgi:allantoin racemase